MFEAETWTITPRFKKALHSCYINLLRKAFNITWQSHITNMDLYGNLSPKSERLTRRMSFAGHCARREREATYRVVLMWQPTHGKRSKGRPVKIYSMLSPEDDTDRNVELEPTALFRTTQTH